MNNLRKVAIIGSGMVGSAISFSLMQGGLFEEIAMIDIDFERAAGETMDIGHGIPYVQPVHIWYGDYKDTSDADIVIVTAGSNQSVGESRNDLVGGNAMIVKSVVKAVLRNGFRGIFLIVTNPVDVMTYITAKTICEFNENNDAYFDPRHVIGSGTVLDTARLKYLLCEKIKISSENINAFIMGEHGDSEIIAWKSANVAGVPLKEFCSYLCNGSTEEGKSCECEDVKSEILEEVRNSAYEIIKRKSVTNYGIATAVSRICTAIIRDEREILSVTSLLDGEYGIKDVCLSIPSIVGAEGILGKLPIPLSHEEERSLRNSANVIKAVIDELEL